MQYSYVIGAVGARALAAPGGAALADLAAGTVFASSDGTEMRWIRVGLASGSTGYLSRRRLHQKGVGFSNPSAESVAVVNEILRKATADWDGILYGMGCKAWIKEDGGLTFSTRQTVEKNPKPCGGQRVDCSGWVAAMMTLAARPFGVKKANRVFKVLETHSDGQIVNVGRHTGIILSGTDIDKVALRAGLVFGINTGDTSWESKDRVFGIDHIVAGFHDASGAYAISQSSGGDGVNSMSWAKWRQKFDTAFRENRVYCVDVMSRGVSAGAGLAPDHDDWVLGGDNAGMMAVQPVFGTEPEAAPG